MTAYKATYSGELITALPLHLKITNKISKFRAITGNLLTSDFPCFVALQTQSVVRHHLSCIRVMVSDSLSTCFLYPCHAVSFVRPIRLHDTYGQYLNDETFFLSSDKPSGWYVFGVHCHFTRVYHHEEFVI